MSQLLKSSRVSSQAAATVHNTRPARLGVVSCAARQSAQVEEPSCSRRQLLATSFLLVPLLPAVPALAACTFTDDEEAFASQSECRQGLLAEDAGKKLDYGGMAENKARTSSTALGVPVSVLDNEYAKATLALSEKIYAYSTTDATDYKVRVPLIKTLKQDCSTWVSKYARGGSARTDSSRRMYIAVDALIGHLSANGYAPMNKLKMTTVLNTVEQAKSFLAQGK